MLRWCNIKRSLAFGCGVTAVLVSVKAARREDLVEASDLNSDHYKQAIQLSQRQVNLFREETGVPGISVAVEVDGKKIWTDGFGFSDVENHTPCQGNTVMRIASISKPITMALVARLWQEGLLDIDKPISYYVPDFPPKIIDGKSHSPTLRQLAAHLGGVRHYRSVEEQRKADTAPPSRRANEDDSSLKEFYSKTRYTGVRESLAVFKDDELVYPPGKRYLYTTYGYSLLGAAAENAGGKSLPVLFRQLFRHLGMSHTHIDDPLLVIQNRSRQYIRTKDGRLENAPYVDCSIKWAGGGLLSSAEDVAHFGSTMLKSYQCTADKIDASCEHSYLSADTMREIWTPHPKTDCWHKSGKYALGWCVLEPSNQKSASAHPLLDDDRPIFTHSGSAVGGTTMLLILPAGDPSFIAASHGILHSKDIKKKSSSHVASASSGGVSVALLTNLGNVRGLGDLALDIAIRFDTARKKAQSSSLSS